MPDAPARSRNLRPRATYRLQFHADFPFSAGRDLAPYLAELGISHLYSSPILTARKGSKHGYDVIDYDQINPELGGEDGFVAMAQALREHGIGIILDIVPNHMAVGGGDNKFWLDLLKNGPKSEFAGWFDIDFDGPDPDLKNKVHAPFLGEPYAVALADGKFSLVEHGPGFALSYGEHLFPIRPQDDDAIRAEGIGAFADTGKLDALVKRQNFLPDWWSNAGDRINWRRFFDIIHLAAMRMDNPKAFAAKHKVAFKLYREGLIDGLRIDHVDGLGDPAEYCIELRRHLDALQPSRPDGLRDERAYLIVEKILASGEHIPVAWDVDGSTGYDFMDQVSAVQHDQAALRKLASHWAVLSGRSRDFHGEEVQARHQILSHSFDGQRERLVDALEEAGAEHRDGEGITRNALRRAVTSLIVEMRAYRSYATGRSDDVGLGDRVEAALRSALAQPMSDTPALKFVASVIAGEGEEAQRPARIEVVRRFNQLSAPLAAKAVEDTAFYRYGRLLSRNDVGFDAGVLGLSATDFHAAMTERGRGMLGSMLATATHDHKRGEDVRARLAVLSECPDAWIDASARWFEMNGAIRPKRFDPADEYMLYQMLVGAWPLGLERNDAAGLDDLRERLSAWQVKALREGKLRSSWSAPDEAYEGAAEEFLAAVLNPARSGGFIDDLVGFVARLAPTGAANALTQLALRLAVPGVPDTYQGCEYWDFSLVDPDNRRPVDFSARRIALAQAIAPERLVDGWRDGRVKQAVLARLLTERKAHPELFAEGDYTEIPVEGARAHHVLAFQRQHHDRRLIVVVGRHLLDGIGEADRLVPPQDWWGDTRLSVRQPGESRPIIGPGLDETARIAALLPDLPVGAWVVED